MKNLALQINDFVIVNVFLSILPLFSKLGSCMFIHKLDYPHIVGKWKYCSLVIDDSISFCTPLFGWRPSAYHSKCAINSWMQILLLWKRQWHAWSGNTLVNGAFHKWCQIDVEITQPSSKCRNIELIPFWGIIRHRTWCFGDFLLFICPAIFFNFFFCQDIAHWNWTKQ